MNKFQTLLSLLTLLSLSSLCAADEKKGEQKVEKGFTRLFDGKSLDGWEGKESVFRIEKGTIIGGQLKERIPNNEFLSSKKKYGDFELRLEAKMIGKGANAGVQFRTKRIPNHHEVIGYQCDMGQMQGSNIWGSLYDESRRRKFLQIGEQKAVKKVFKDGGWNEFRIRCEGDRIQIWLNGAKTVDYAEKDESVERSGVIALQIHGGPPSESHYRNIRIRELK